MYEATAVRMAEGYGSVTTGAACSPLICLHPKWIWGFLTGVLLWLQNPYPPNTPKTACVQLGFLPLNHLMGRMTLLKCLLTGGQVHHRLQSAEIALEIDSDNETC